MMVIMADVGQGPSSFPCSWRVLSVYSFFIAANEWLQPLTPSLMTHRKLGCLFLCIITYIYISYSIKYKAHTYISILKASHKSTQVHMHLYLHTFQCIVLFASFPIDYIKHIHIHTYIFRYTSICIYIHSIRIVCKFSYRLWLHRSLYHILVEAALHDVPSPARDPGSNEYNFMSGLYMPILWASPK